jgi:uncharacterized protein with PQ loop repeat
MPEMSLRHIDQISRDIHKQEISFSHLGDELIDHVCCDVEYEMQHGLDFSEAYNKVRGKIGSRGLKQIQEETLYAVDTKYRYMKNLMKISGVAGTALFGFAAMYKIQHWPGASIMMTLGALIMVFAFLPSVLVVLWKETHNTKRLLLFISAFLTGTCFVSGTLFKIQHWPYAGAILTVGAIIGVLVLIPSLLVNRMRDIENKPRRPAYILGAIGSMLFVAGLLFKIQHWPLATTIMVAGLILLVIIALPLYTWLTWKEEGNISPVFIFMIVGSLLIIMPGALINLNLQHSYQDYYYPNNSSQNEMYNYLYRNNISLLSRFNDSSSYKQMEEMHSKTIAMLEAVTTIQEKMVEQSEAEFGKQALRGTQIRQSSTGHEIVYSEISNPMDPGPFLTFLLPGCTTRKELSSSMADYVNYISGIVPGDGLTNYKNMLDADTYLPIIGPDGEGISLMSGLHSLQIMKNGLLTVESSVLKAIAMHK